MSDKPTQSAKSTSTGASTKAKPKKTSSASPKKQTLAQAQSAAQVNLQSHSASIDQIGSFLSRKANLGKLFTPTEIAAGMGNGIGDRDIRKTFQKAGLAKGKEGVIESGERWLHLNKSGNRNQYAATEIGTPLAPAS